MAGSNLSNFFSIDVNTNGSLNVAGTFQSLLAPQALFIANISTATGSITNSRVIGDSGRFNSFYSYGHKNSSIFNDNMIITGYNYATNSGYANLVTTKVPASVILNTGQYDNWTITNPTIYQVSAPLTLVDSGYTLSVSSILLSEDVREIDDSPIDGYEITSLGSSGIFDVTIKGNLNMNDEFIIPSISGSPGQTLVIPSVGDTLVWRSLSGVDALQGEIPFGGCGGGSLTTSPNLSFNCKQGNIILGGYGDYFYNNDTLSCNTGIIGGYCNGVYYGYSSIISGGYYNYLSYSSNTSIIGGQYNDTDGTNDGIIGGGRSNRLSNSNKSAILGGYQNSINSSSNSIILGGNSLSLTSQDNTVLIPKLLISNNTNNFMEILDSSSGGSVIFTGPLSATNTIQVPDASGTLALTSQIPESSHGESDPQSGDGVTTSFLIPYLTGTAPTFANIIPLTADATGLFYLGFSGTNIQINYLTAPPLGTNNLSWFYQAIV